ncbi:MAG: hypothetical protein AAF944_05365 [Bacteroidota bacterium]
MKISRELLKKYARGTCTDEERAAVETWLAAEDTFEDTSYDAIFIPQKDSIRENLQSRLWGDRPAFTGQSEQARVVPLYQRLSRYAAAACILLLTFFGGRLSVSTANATSLAVKPLKDRLHVFGQNGVKTQIYGQEFKVVIDGTVKLFNGSFATKTLVVGDTSFVLESQQTYYLTGTNENPKFLNLDILYDDNYSFREPPLGGYFSFHCMEN